MKSNRNHWIILFRSERRSSTKRIHDADIDESQQPVLETRVLVADAHNGKFRSVVGVCGLEKRKFDWLISRLDQ